MSSSSPSSSSSSGVGLGVVIAVVLSWSINHSVLWCVLHGFCGWGYILFWALGWAYGGSP